MPVKKGVWQGRWEALRARGLDLETAMIIFEMFDDAKAFQFQKTSDQAWAKLLEVYGEDSTIPYDLVRALRATHTAGVDKDALIV